MPALTLNDRYELTEMLGRGGYATVWRGQDLRLERPVAVKVLDASASGDPAAVERLRREARAVAQLAHPNIVAVHDFGEDFLPPPGGGQARVPYLVMELVDGESLASLIARSPLPVDSATAIAAQVCDALGAAHAEGVIHRDIKPGNILVTRRGVAKVCDFGVARLQHAAHATLTAPTNVVGTSEYMAPEQATGGEMDGRADLYSLGCLLYAMVSGAPPFTGDDPIGVLHRHLSEEPTPIRDVREDAPADLDALLVQLLSKDPNRRPIDASAVASRLRTLSATSSGAFTARAAAAAPTATGRATAPAPAPTPTRTFTAVDPYEDFAPRASRSRWWLGAAAAAVALVIVVALAIGVLTSKHAPQTGAASAPPSTAPATAASALPTGPAGAVAALRTAIQTQSQAGQLDAKAANDLTAIVDDVAHRIERDQLRQAAERIGTLRNMLTSLRRQNKITPTGYTALKAAADQAAGALPEEN